MLGLQLRSGLAGGTGPAGQLSGGLGKLEAGVAKFRGALPSTGGGGGLPARRSDANATGGNAAAMPLRHNGALRGRAR